MEEKQREQKRARTVRSDYATDLDEVQAWIRQAELKVQDRSVEPLTLKEHLKQVQDELGTITDKLERLTRNGRTIAENTKDEPGKQLIENTIHNVTEQFNQVKSWLDERKQVVADTVDAWHRFLNLYKIVRAWTEEKRQFLLEPLSLSTLAQARQRSRDYSTAVKSCKQINKHLSDMGKELETIGQVCSVGDLTDKLIEADEGKVQVESQLSERNSLLQETSEEWEQCERKLKEAKTWIEKAGQSLESAQNKKKPLRDQHSICEKMLSDIAIQKTRISLSMEKLQVHFRSGIGGDSRIGETVEELLAELETLNGTVKGQTASLEACLAQIDQYQQDIQQLRQQIMQVEQELRTVLSPTYLTGDKEKALQEQQSLQERMEEWKQRIRVQQERICSADPYYVPSNDYKLTSQASYADIAAGRTSPSSRGSSPYRNLRDDSAPLSTSLAIQVLRPTAQLPVQKLVPEQPAENAGNAEETGDTVDQSKQKKEATVSEEPTKEYTTGTEIEMEGKKPHPGKRTSSRGRATESPRETRTFEPEEPEGRRPRLLLERKQKEPVTLRCSLVPKEDRRGRSASPIWVPGSASYADILRGNAQLSLQSLPVELGRETVPGTDDTSDVETEIENANVEIPIEMSEEANTQEDMVDELNEANVEKYDTSTQMAVDNAKEEEQHMTCQTSWAEESVEKYDLLDEKHYDNVTGEQTVPPEVYSYIHPAMPVSFTQSQIPFPVSPAYVCVPAGPQMQPAMALPHYAESQIGFPGEYVAQPPYIPEPEMYQDQSHPGFKDPLVEKATTMIMQENIVLNPMQAPLDIPPMMTTSVENVEYNNPADSVKPANSPPSSNENKGQTYSYAQALSQGLGPRSLPTSSGKSNGTQQVNERSRSPADLPASSLHETIPPEEFSLQETELITELPVVKPEQPKQEESAWDTTKVAKASGETKPRQLIEPREKVQKEKINTVKQVAKIQAEPSLVESESPMKSNELNGQQPTDKQEGGDAVQVGNAQQGKKRKPRRKKKKNTAKSTDDDIDKVIRGIDKSTEEAKEKREILTDKSKEQDRPEQNDGEVWENENKTDESNAVFESEKANENAPPLVSSEKTKEENEMKNVKASEKSKKQSKSKTEMKSKEITINVAMGKTKQQGKMKKQGKEKLRSTETKNIKDDVKANKDSNKTQPTPKESSPNEIITLESKKAESKEGDKIETKAEIIISKQDAKEEKSDKEATTNSKKNKAQPIAPKPAKADTSTERLSKLSKDAKNLKEQSELTEKKHAKTETKAELKSDSKDENKPTKEGVQGKPKEQDKQKAATQSKETGKNKNSIKPREKQTDVANGNKGRDNTIKQEVPKENQTVKKLAKESGEKKQVKKKSVKEKEEKADINSSRNQSAKKDTGAQKQKEIAESIKKTESALSEVKILNDSIEEKDKMKEELEKNPEQLTVKLSIQQEEQKAPPVALDKQLDPVVQKCELMKPKSSKKDIKSKEQAMNKADRKQDNPEKEKKSRRESKKVSPNDDVKKGTQMEKQSALKDEKKQKKGTSENKITTESEGLAAKEESKTEIVTEGKKGEKAAIMIPDKLIKSAASEPKTSKHIVLSEALNIENTKIDAKEKVPVKEILNTEETVAASMEQDSDVKEEISVESKSQMNVCKVSTEIPKHQDIATKSKEKTYIEKKSYDDLTIGSEPSKDTSETVNIPVASFKQEDTLGKPVKAEELLVLSDSFKDGMVLAETKDSIIIEDKVIETATLIGKVKDETGATEVSSEDSVSIETTQGQKKRAVGSPSKIKKPNKSKEKVITEKIAPTYVVETKEVPKNSQPSSPKVEKKSNNKKQKRKNDAAALLPIEKETAISEGKAPIEKSIVLTSITTAVDADRVVKDATKPDDTPLNVGTLKMRSDKPTEVKESTELPAEPATLPSKMKEEELIESVRVDNPKETVITKEDAKEKAQIQKKVEPPKFPTPKKPQREAKQKSASQEQMRAIESMKDTVKQELIIEPEKEIEKSCAEETDKQTGTEVSECKIQTGECQSAIVRERMVETTQSVECMPQIIRENQAAESQENLALSKQVVEFKGDKLKSKQRDTPKKKGKKIRAEKEEMGVTIPEAICTDGSVQGDESSAASIREEGLVIEKTVTETARILSSAPDSVEVKPRNVKPVESVENIPISQTVDSKPTELITLCLKTVEANTASNSARISDHPSVTPSPGKIDALPESKELVDLAKAVYFDDQSVLFGSVQDRRKIRSEVSNKVLGETVCPISVKEKGAKEMIQVKTEEVCSLELVKEEAGKVESSKEEVKADREEECSRIEEAVQFSGGTEEVSGMARKTNGMAIEEKDIRATKLKQINLTGNSGEPTEKDVTQTEQDNPGSKRTLTKAENSKGIISNIDNPKPKPKGVAAYYSEDLMKPYWLDYHSYIEAENQFYRRFKVVQVQEGVQLPASASRRSASTERIVKGSVMKEEQVIQEEKVPETESRKDALIIEGIKYPVIKFQELESELAKTKKTEDQISPMVEEYKIETCTEKSVGEVRVTDKPEVKIDEKCEIMTDKATQGEETSGMKEEIGTEKTPSDAALRKEALVKEVAKYSYSRIQESEIQFEERKQAENIKSPVIQVGKVITAELKDDTERKPESDIIGAEKQEEQLPTIKVPSEIESRTLALVAKPIEYPVTTFYELEAELIKSRKNHKFDVALPLEEVKAADLVIETTNPNMNEGKKPQETEIRKEINTAPDGMVTTGERRENINELVVEENKPSEMESRKMALVAEVAKYSVSEFYDLEPQFAKRKTDNVKPSNIPIEEPQKTNEIMPKQIKEENEPVSESRIKGEMKEKETKQKDVRETPFEMESRKFALTADAVKYPISMFQQLEPELAKVWKLEDKKQEIISPKEVITRTIYEPVSEVKIAKTEKEEGEHGQKEKKIVEKPAEPMERKIQGSQRKDIFEPVESRKTALIAEMIRHPVTQLGQLEVQLAMKICEEKSKAAPAEETVIIDEMSKIQNIDMAEKELTKEIVVEPATKVLEESNEEEKSTKGRYTEYPITKMHQSESESELANEVAIDNHNLVSAPAEIKMESEEKQIIETIETDIKPVETNLELRIDETAILLPKSVSIEEKTETEEELDYECKIKITPEIMESLAEEKKVDQEPKLKAKYETKNSTEICAAADVQEDANLKVSKISKDVKQDNSTQDKKDRIEMVTEKENVMEIMQDEGPETKSAVAEDIKTESENIATREDLKNVTEQAPEMQKDTESIIIGTPTENIEKAVCEIVEIHKLNKAVVVENLNKKISGNNTPSTVSTERLIETKEESSEGKIKDAKCAAESVTSKDEKEGRITDVMVEKKNEASGTKELFKSTEIKSGDDIVDSQTQKSIETQETVEEIKDPAAVNELSIRETQLLRLIPESTQAKTTDKVDKQKSKESAKSSPKSGKQKQVETKLDSKPKGSMSEKEFKAKREAKGKTENGLPSIAMNPIKEQTSKVTEIVQQTPVATVITPQEEENKDTERNERISVSTKSWASIVGAKSITEINAEGTQMMKTCGVVADSPVGTSRPEKIEKPEQPVPETSPKRDPSAHASAVKTLKQQRKKETVSEPKPLSPVEAEVAKQPAEQIVETSRESPELPEGSIKEYGKSYAEVTASNKRGSPQIHNEDLLLFKPIPLGSDQQLQKLVETKSSIAPEFSSGKPSTPEKKEKGGKFTEEISTPETKSIISEEPIVDKSTKVELLSWAEEVEQEMSLASSEISESKGIKTTVESIEADSKAMVVDSWAVIVGKKIIDPIESSTVHIPDIPPSPRKQEQPSERSHPQVQIHVEESPVSIPIEEVITVDEQGFVEFVNRRELRSRRSRSRSRSVRREELQRPLEDQDSAMESSSPEKHIPKEEKRNIPVTPQKIDTPKKKEPKDPTKKDLPEKNKLEQDVSKTGKQEKEKLEKQISETVKVEKEMSEKDKLEKDKQDKEIAGKDKPEKLVKDKSRKGKGKPKPNEDASEIEPKRDDVDAKVIKVCETEVEKQPEKKNASKHKKSKGGKDIIATDDGKDIQPPAKDVKITQEDKKDAQSANKDDKAVHKSKKGGKKNGKLIQDGKTGSTSLSRKENTAEESKIKSKVSNKETEEPEKEMIQSIVPHGSKKKKLKKSKIDKEEIETTGGQSAPINVNIVESTKKKEMSPALQSLDDLNIKKKEISESDNNVQQTETVAEKSAVKKRNRKKKNKKLQTAAEQTIEDSPKDICEMKIEDGRPATNEKGQKEKEEINVEEKKAEPDAFRHVEAMIEEKTSETKLEIHKKQGEEEEIAKSEQIDGKSKRNKKKRNKGKSVSKGVVSKETEETEGESKTSLSDIKELTQAYKEEVVESPKAESGKEAAKGKAIELATDAQELITVIKKEEKKKPPLEIKLARDPENIEMAEEKAEIQSTKKESATAAMQKFKQDKSKKGKQQKQKSKREDYKATGDSEIAKKDTRNVVTSVPVEEKSMETKDEGRCDIQDEATLICPLSENNVKHEAADITETEKTEEKDPTEKKIHILDISETFTASTSHAKTQTFGEAEVKKVKESDVQQLVEIHASESSSNKQTTVKDAGETEIMEDTEINIKTEPKAEPGTIKEIDTKIEIIESIEKQRNAVTTPPKAVEEFVDKVTQEASTKRIDTLPEESDKFGKSASEEIKFTQKNIVCDYPAGKLADEKVIEEKSIAIKTTKELLVKEPGQTVKSVIDSVEIKVPALETDVEDNESKPNGTLTNNASKKIEPETSVADKIPTFSSKLIVQHSTDQDSIHIPENEDEIECIPSDPELDMFEEPMEPPKSKVQFFIADEALVISPEKRKPVQTPLIIKSLSELSRTKFLSLDSGFWPDKHPYHEAERYLFETLTVDAKRKVMDSTEPDLDDSDSYGDGDGGGDLKREQNGDSFGDSYSSGAGPQTERLIADLPGGIGSSSDYSTYLSTENEQRSDRSLQFVQSVEDDPTRVPSRTEQNLSSAISSSISTEPMLETAFDSEPSSLNSIPNPAEDVLKRESNLGHERVRQTPSSPLASSQTTNFPHHPEPEQHLGKETDGLVHRWATPNVEAERETGLADTENWIRGIKDIVEQRLMVLKLSVSNLKGTYLPRDNIETMLSGLTKLLEELQAHSREAAQLREQLETIPPDTESQRLRSSLTAVEDRIATLLSQAEQGRAALEEARGYQEQRGYNIHTYKQFLDETDAWLKNIVASMKQHQTASSNKALQDELSSHAHRVSELESLPEISNLAKVLKNALLEVMTRLQQRQQVSNAFEHSGAFANTTVS